MGEITVALDWTPNTNHVGFYVALQQGLYDKAGLRVRLLSPGEANSGYEGSYQEISDEKKVYQTPCSLVAQGKATFGINSAEGCIGWNSPTEAGTFDRTRLTAVAALLQGSDSAIVARADSGISRPRDLDGKVYASYAARYEGRIVQRMIQNDGGTGNYEERVSPMLGLWNTVLAGNASATWVFMGWEGIEAKRKGIELNAFKLEDYGIPYGYAPILMASPETLTGRSADVKAFLAATTQGYQFAAQNSAAAAEALVEGASEHNKHTLDVEMVKDSAAYLADKFLNSNGEWGSMESERWNTYLDWLHEAKLLTAIRQSRSPKGGASATLDQLRDPQHQADHLLPRSAFEASSIFTNEYLPKAE